MSNHDELVAEMAVAEKMPMIERLKLAKKRRAQQLKTYAQYEKELNKNAGSGVTGKGKSSKKASTRPKGTGRLQFTGSILLLDAAARNDVAEVKNLLNSGVGPNAANEDGLTALHQCCIDGLDEMMKVLLESGANVDSRDSEQWTPLHAAATCGHVGLCRQLCDHGANLLAVNADGNMPYDLCEDVNTLDYIESEMAKRGVTQELIDETRAATENAMLSDMQNIVNAKGDIEIRGRSGETPLHVAACNGYIGVAEFLISHGASVGVTDNDDWQPIHCAVCWGQLNMVKFLLEHGADIDSKTRNGETALDLCEDVELRHGILELLDELHNNSLELSLSANSLQRRNSSAKRNNSGVISAHALMRRTSVQEKNAMSTKDKLGEANRFREMMQLGVNEDEDEATNTDNKASIAAGDISVSVDASSPSKKSIDSPRKTASSPANEPAKMTSVAGVSVEQTAYASSPSGMKSSEIKNGSTPNGDIFWQSSAPASSSAAIDGNSVAVDERLQPPVTVTPVPPASPVFLYGSEAGRASATSLSDLKKHRAKQRQERLYRRRGSVDSDEALTSPVTGAASQNGGAAVSASVQALGEQTNDDRPRRKHSNRYDLVMPEKRNDACCSLM